MAESPRGGVYGQVADIFRTVSAKCVSSSDIVKTKPIVLMGGIKLAMKTSEHKKTFYSLLESIPWMTYRKDFPRIQPSTLTSDAGWGCMLRSAQMMAAHAFQRHYYCCWGAGDASAKSEGHAAQAKWQQQILRWFHDSPADDAFYSIHKLVQYGTHFNKQPGEWYGPTEVSLVLQRLCCIHQMGAGGPLKVFVSKDRVIDAAEIHTYCTTKALQPLATTSSVKGSCVGADAGAGGEWVCALLLLVPLRIGLDIVNESQGRALLHALELPQSVGVIGGRPRHSLYFVGAQESKLICLDPHTIKKTIDWTRDKDILSSYSCSTPSLLPISALDPTLALGFYVRDRAAFASFCQLAQQKIARPDRTPLFTFASKSKRDVADVGSTGIKSAKSSTPTTISSDSDDEYVLL